MSDSPLELKNVAVAAHPKVRGAAPEAAQIAAYLSENGLEAAAGEVSDEAFCQRISDGEFDLVIALGGDGTVLRVGHLCADCDVPILGINLGKFGFLVEVAKGGWRQALPGLFEGEYWIEHRMMLQAEQWRKKKCLGSWELLNEAMVGRGRIVRPVHLATEVDGVPLATYVADGLIVATATGSTAYALAAGGPILPPEMRNILIMPVAPHLSVDRAVVLAEGSVVRVTVSTEHQAVLSVDGQPPISLKDGDEVKVQASEHTLQFLRFQSADYFYRNLIALMDQNPAAGENS